MVQFPRGNYGDFSTVHFKRDLRVGFDVALWAAAYLGVEAINKGQGVMMTRKLSDADRAAVDLLLDRTQAAKAAGNGNGGDGMVVMSNAVADERLSAVQKVLSALDAMAAPEPPVDLAVRTLQKIARAANEPRLIQGQQPGQSMIDPSAPLA